MALGAHEVPVLVELGPVQDVVVTDLLVGIEVEPALTACLLRSAIPRDRQGLQSAIGEFDQVLLKRIEPECVLDLESGELAVGAVGLDQKFVVLAKEARAHTVVVEGHIGEIAQNRLLGRMSHRVLVLRGLPQRGLRLVATGAGFAADERGGCFASDIVSLLPVDPHLIRYPTHQHQGCSKQNADKNSLLAIAPALRHLGDLVALEMPGARSFEPSRSSSEPCFESASRLPYLHVCTRDLKQATGYFAS